MKKILSTFLAVISLMSGLIGCSRDVTNDSNVQDLAKDTTVKMVFDQSDQIDGENVSIPKQDYIESIPLIFSNYDYYEAVLSDTEIISTRSGLEEILLFGHKAKYVQKKFCQAGSKYNYTYEFYDVDTKELFFAAIGSKIRIVDTVNGQNDVLISEYEFDNITRYDIYYSTSGGVKKAELDKDIEKALPSDAYNLRIYSKNCFIYNTPGKHKDGKISTYCCFDLSDNSVMIYDTWNIIQEPYEKFESNNGDWYTDIEFNQEGYICILSVNGPDGKKFTFTNEDLEIQAYDSIICRELIVHPTQKYAALIYNGSNTANWSACTVCSVISLESGKIINIDDSECLAWMKSAYFNSNGTVNYSEEKLNTFALEKRHSNYPAHRIRHFVSITEDGFDIKVAGTDIEGNIVLDNIYRYAVPANLKNSLVKSVFSKSKQ